MTEEYNEAERIGVELRVNANVKCIHWLFYNIEDYQVAEYWPKTNSYHLRFNGERGKIPYPEFINLLEKSQNEWIYNTQPVEINSYTGRQFAIKRTLRKMNYKKKYRKHKK
jgi:hypothetical protein